MSLSQEELKYFLIYNRDSGIFIRNKSTSNRANKGDIAGCITKRGYVRIKVKGKSYQAHRLAWLYEYGKFPDNEIDHINHIKDDNRISNLREVSRTGNNRNRSLSKNNTSGQHGVSFRKSVKKWRASIGVKGDKVYLGDFTLYSDAVNARKNAEVLYGYHDNHGGSL